MSVSVVSGWLLLQALAAMGSSLYFPQRGLFNFALARRDADAPQEKPYPKITPEGNKHFIKSNDSIPNLTLLRRASAMDKLLNSTEKNFQDPGNRQRLAHSNSTSSKGSHSTQKITDPDCDDEASSTSITGENGRVDRPQSSPKSGSRDPGAETEKSPTQYARGASPRVWNSLKSHERSVKNNPVTAKPNFIPSAWRHGKRENGFSEVADMLKSAARKTRGRCILYGPKTTSDADSRPLQRESSSGRNDNSIHKAPAMVKSNANPSGGLDGSAVSVGSKVIDNSKNKRGGGTKPGIKDFFIVDRGYSKHDNTTHAGFEAIGSLQKPASGLAKSPTTKPQSRFPADANVFSGKNDSKVTVSLDNPAQEAGDEAGIQHENRREGKSPQHSERKNKKKHSKATPSRKRFGNLLHGDPSKTSRKVTRTANSAQDAASDDSLQSAVNRLMKKARRSHRSLTDLETGGWLETVLSWL